MEEIGRRLRAAREAKGITLEQAEEDTKIRRKYLQALEAGREVDIPGEVYLKGFLRSYGNYLGLNGTALVDEYKRLKLQARMKEMTGREAEPAVDTVPSTASGAPEPAVRREEDQPEAPQTPPQNPPQAALTPRAERAARQREARAARQSAQRADWETSELAQQQAADRSPRRETAERRSSQRPPLSRTRGRGGQNRAMRRTLTILVACLLFGGAAWAAYYQLSGARAGAPQDQGQQGDVQTAPPDASGGADNQADSGGSVTENGIVRMEIGQDQRAHFAVRAPRAEVRLESGVDEVWLSAEGDGQLLFEGKLPEGEKEPLYFRGQQVVVDIGFMDGISLTVNGEQFEKPLSGGPWILVFEAEAE